MTFTTSSGLASLSPEILHKLDRASVELQTSYKIDRSKYDNVFVTSDIHCDVLKLDNMLKNVGLVTPSPIAGFITALSAKIPTMEWLPERTLLILVGDIVDGHRHIDFGPPSSIPDPTGNIELLLHAYLYNLRIKARAKNSELLFTIGNHDYLTVILEDDSQNKGFYKNYVHPSAAQFFGSRQNRRTCLLPFYNCCPYVMLDLGGEVAFIHGGFLGYDDAAGQMINNTNAVKTIQKHLDATHNFSALSPNDHLLLNNIGGDRGTGYEYSPLWSRAYARLSPDEVCPTISNFYKMVVVGHCQMALDCGSEGYHSAHILSKKAYTKYKCGGENGCVAIGCDSLLGPQLAFVDIAFSRAFSGFLPRRLSKSDELGRRAEMLVLRHITQIDFTKRYYNVIMRKNAGTPTTRENDEILMWMALSKTHYEAIDSIKQDIRDRTLDFLRSPEYGFEDDNFEIYSEDILPEYIQQVDANISLSTGFVKSEAKRILKKYIVTDLYMDTLAIQNDKVPTPLHFMAIDKSTEWLARLLENSNIPADWFLRPLPPDIQENAAFYQRYTKDNLLKYASMNFIEIISVLLSEEKDNANVIKLYTMEKNSIEFLLGQPFGDKREILSHLLKFQTPSAPTFLHYAAIKEDDDLIAGLIDLNPPINWVDIQLPAPSNTGFYSKFDKLIPVKFANKSARGIIDKQIIETTDESKLALLRERKTSLLQIGAKPKTARTLKSLYRPRLAKAENEQFISNNWRRSLSVNPKRGGRRKTKKTNYR